MVSYYYHHKNIEILGCEGTVQDFAEHFIKEQGIYVICVIQGFLNQ